MNIDWSSVLIVIVCVASIVATVWLDEKIKEWKRKEASPFPLFNLTNEEANLLCTLYHKEVWFVPWLCHEIILEKGRNYPLLKKVREAIGDCTFLTTWMICHRGNYQVKGLSSKDNTVLRKQWIVALLEYNNMQEKLK
jgi:hypothetical protein